MDIVKCDGCGGFPWAEVILIAFGLVMLVLVWRSMRRPHPPSWSKASRRGGKR
jgi:hypothetical protein